MRIKDVFEYVYSKNLQCGIPENIIPDALINVGQVNSVDPVDWWILVIRIYEMIGGQYSSCDEDPMDLY